MSVQEIIKLLQLMPSSAEVAIGKDMVVGVGFATNRIDGEQVVVFIAKTKMANGTTGGMPR